MSWLTTYFASPIALLGLLAISIPIVIHLLSKSKAKPVLFGHLDLIPSGKQKPVTQLTITQWLLLLLRILMLVTLTLLLSQPLRPETSSTNPQQTTLLITSQWLDYADKAQRDALLDRLSNGAQALLAGHPSTPLSAEQIQNWQAREDADNLINLWSTVDDTLNHTAGRIAVYHTGKIEQFNGPRTILTSTSERVEWQQLDVPFADTEVSLIKPISIGVIESDEPDINLRLQKALSLIKQYGIKTLSWQKEPLEQQADFSQFALWIDIREMTVSSQHSIVAVPPTRVNAPDFPLWLANQLLLLSGQQEQRVSPVLSAQQIQYRAKLPDNDTVLAVPAMHSGYQRDDPARSVVPWLATLLLLLFCAERLVSEYFSPAGKETRQ
ncbi:hypothetical protein BFC17_10390 [Alteromonas lipolytica]|uniref:Aerotolerance regulator N-terminal domain-containing protein n=2 Tax=Alteromonas lipolytica TaxID=1856405 RepID=A0A1E8FJF4_9ALTE|nr:hypothetical protein BFC17_10390 [Alteromonas lipolytica]